MVARFSSGGHLIKVMPNSPSDGQPAVVEIHSMEVGVMCVMFCIKISKGSVPSWWALLDFMPKLLHITCALEGKLRMQNQVTPPQKKKVQVSFNRYRE